MTDTADHCEDRLRLDLPLPAGNGPIAAGVASALRDHRAALLPLLERLVDTGDAGVTVPVDDIGIDTVTLDDDGTAGVAELRYVARFFAGCRGLDERDRHRTALPFRIDDGRLRIDLALPIRWQVDL